MNYLVEIENAGRAVAVEWLGIIAIVAILYWIVSSATRHRR